MFSLPSLLFSSAAAPTLVAASAEASEEDGNTPQASPLFLSSLSSTNSLHRTFVHALMLLSASAKATRDVSCAQRGESKLKE